MADIGRKVCRGDTLRPRADKPKGYEPTTMLQEFARARRTFAFCSCTIVALLFRLEKRHCGGRTSAGWGGAVSAASSQWKPALFFGKFALFHWKAQCQSSIGSG